MSLQGGRVADHGQLGGGQDQPVRTRHGEQPLSYCGDARVQAWILGEVQARILGEVQTRMQRLGAA